MGTPTSCRSTSPEGFHTPPPTKQQEMGTSTSLGSNSPECFHTPRRLPDGWAPRRAKAKRRGASPSTRPPGTTSLSGIFLKVHLVIKGLAGHINRPMKQVHTHLEIDILEPDTKSINLRDPIRACHTHTKGVPSLKSIFGIFTGTSLVGWRLRYRRRHIIRIRKTAKPWVTIKAD